MRVLRLAPIVALLAVLGLAALPSVPLAKEESIVIFTSTDTRSELAPCG